MSANIPYVTRWTPEHKARVGELIGDEIDRRGWNPATAAVELDISEKTVRRVRNGVAAPNTMRVVADQLGLAAADYMPPRDITEQTQLDRIEAMLAALLAAKGISVADVLRAAADAKAAGQAELEATLEAAPPPPDTPHSDSA